LFFYLACFPPDVIISDNNKRAGDNAPAPSKGLVKD